MGNSTSKSSSRGSAASVAKPLNTRGVNLVLSLLPSAERERIVGRCEKKLLKIEEVLYEAGGPIPYVYFPLWGMVSMVLGSEGGGP